MHHCCSAASVLELQTMKSSKAGWCAVLVTVMCAPGLIGQSALRISGVPFRDSVEIMINGQGPYRFGLDLGSSPAFLILPELAHQLNLPVTSHTQMHGPVDRATDPPVDVVRIDDLLLAEHPFQHAIGIAYANASPMVKGGSGTLGIGLFQKVVVKLDYPANRMSVSDMALPVEDGKHVFKYTEVHLRPYLDIVVGGVPVNACLDTGAKGIGVDLAVPAEFASHLRLKNVTKSSSGLNDIVGHQREFSTATLDGNLTIGDIVVKDPTLLISNEVPFVDLAGIVNKMVITLDSQNHRLKLDLPEQ